MSYDMGFWCHKSRYIMVGFSTANLHTILISCFMTWVATVHMFSVMTQVVHMHIHAHTHTHTCAVIHTHTHTHTHTHAQWYTHTHYMHTHILIFCQCHITLRHTKNVHYLTWKNTPTKTQINQTLSYKMAKAIPARTHRQTHQKPQSANHWPHPPQHPRKCEESTERCVVPGTLQRSSPSTRTESGAWEEQRWAGGRTQSCPPPCWPPPAWQGGSGRWSATVCWRCEGGWAPAAGQRYPRNLQQTNDSQSLDLTEIAITIICIIFMHYNLMTRLVALQTFSSSYIALWVLALACLGVVCQNHRERERMCVWVSVCVCARVCAAPHVVIQECDI